MVFKFRMLSDENDSFVRDYEVMYDMTLLDFHRYICANLGYDPDNMASFFTSNQQWEKLFEFTLMDMGTEDGDSDNPSRTMDSVCLGQIIRNRKERLIYTFDMFADRSYFLELQQSTQADADVEYPRTCLSEGEAPDQFDPDAAGGYGSIFDEAMSEFNDFAGDESCDDEY